jgi:L-aminopeptidase/D-esterase-like protein
VLVGSAEVFPAFNSWSGDVPFALSTGRDGELSSGQDSSQFGVIHESLDAADPECLGEAIAACL